MLPSSSLLPAFSAFDDDDNDDDDSGQVDLPELREALLNTAPEQLDTCGRRFPVLRPPDRGYRHPKPTYKP